LASLLTEDILRHRNGLKHINIVDSEGFSALFVVNTPIFDNSGVAHAVEHMVFRRSTAFPKPETLFQLTSLTDAKINASTFAETTYFHCQSQCCHTFLLAINYLLHGLFTPIVDADDLRCEIHDDGDKGVIYRELLGSEQINANSTEANDKNEFCYGGLSASIGELSINDLKGFHHRFYHANNITLVTANADIEQIANLVSLLPKPEKQAEHEKFSLDKHHKKIESNKESEQDQKKYSHTINKLITLYQLWSEDPFYQQLEHYKEIKSTDKTLITNTDRLSEPFSSDLIFPLATLSNKLLKQTVNNTKISPTALPNLFSRLFQQTIKFLDKNKVTPLINQAYSCDQQNALWIVGIGANDQALATITSYIISAYPKFLAPRCQGSCYAIQSLTIENSTYLTIYSAFDVSPDTRMKETSLSLLALSQDNHFISASLALAKIKYCHVNQTQTDQVNHITSSDIANYLQAIANGPHPKV
jgi:hypothetical protein